MTKTLYKFESYVELFREMKNDIISRMSEKVLDLKVLEPRDKIEGRESRI